VWAWQKARLGAQDGDVVVLDGTVALTDASHTQVQTAHIIAQEGGGHFMLFAKGNQGHLLE